MVRERSPRRLETLQFSLQLYYLFPSTKNPLRYQATEKGDTWTASLKVESSRDIISTYSVLEN